MKKFFLILSLLLGVFIFLNVIYANDIFKFGDADSDGEISASDAAQIMQKVLVETHKTPLESKTEKPFKYLDVTADGNIAADDAATVLQKTLVETYKMPCETKGDDNIEKAVRKKNILQTGDTTDVPNEYLTVSDKPGKVVKIEYDTEDYYRNERDITKTAYVYLPYGYNENEQYDIFYFMHGWTGTADEFFTIMNGSIKNMADHMIENDDIPPTIFVAATFDADNAPQDFGTSVGELRQFHLDFKNALMPAVESKYSTYAKSVSDEDLKVSRAHRAFGGFSLGSVTTWNEFVYNYDYIGYFLPMSGACWYYGGYGDYYPVETCDYFEDMINKNDLNERGYFIYAATGTRDAVLDQVEIQMSEMLDRKDFFTDEHLVYYMKQGGVHDMVAVREYIYNALPVFFGGE